MIPTYHWPDAVGGNEKPTAFDAERLVWLIIMGLAAWGLILIPLCLLV
jgi:hypothetical protein